MDHWHRIVTEYEWDRQMSLTFVHLSDIHFTANESGLARRNESLRIDVLNDISTMAASIGPASAILITGDIAFSGLPAEYDLARSWLDEVTTKALAPATAVQCVPGNHDVQREVVGLSGEAIRDLLRRANPDETNSVLDPLLLEQGQPLYPPLRNYIDFATEYRCEIGKDPYWQTDLELGDGHILSIRGLTTVLASDRRDVRPNMVVGTTQSTLPLDRKDRVYLVMGHHPPDWWHDADAVLDSMRNRCSILLCGHKHTQRIEQVDEMLRVTAGAVHPEEDRAWEPRYNWLRLEVESEGSGHRLQVKIWPRVFTRAANAFGPDVQLEGRDYAEYSLQLGQRKPAATLASNPDSQQPQKEQTADDQVEESIPSEVLRPPLINEEGGVVLERDVVRSFLRLPYTAQMRILQKLNLLEDDDLHRQHSAIASAALGRARERGLTAEVSQAVASEQQDLEN